MEWPDHLSFRLEFLSYQDFLPFLLCYNLYSRDLPFTLQSFKFWPTSFIHHLDCNSVLRVPNLHQTQTLAICDLAFCVYKLVFSRMFFHALSSVQILCCDSWISQSASKAHLSYSVIQKLHLCEDSCVTFFPLPRRKLLSWSLLLMIMNKATTNIHGLLCETQTQMESHSATCK